MSSVGARLSAPGTRMSEAIRHLIGTTRTASPHYFTAEEFYRIARRLDLDPDENASGKDLQREILKHLGTWDQNVTNGNLRNRDMEALLRAEGKPVGWTP